MKKQKLSVAKKIIITSFAILLVGIGIVGAQSITKDAGVTLQTSVLHTTAKKIPTPTTTARRTSRIFAQTFVPKEVLTPIMCAYEVPKNINYDAEVLVKSTRITTDPGGAFTVNIQMKNNGNVPWFGDASGCTKNVTRLGTARARDRESVFFNPGDSRWVSGHRITMQEERVNPGEVATFVFAGKAPNSTDIFREYFQPIVEGVSWMDTTKSTVQVDVYVGDITYEHAEKSKYLGTSGQTSALDLSGPQVIEVSIADQKMWLKFGDTVVREYTVSTGAYKTPTPLGRFKILNKQELRIGGAAPHYRMPSWQGFTKWGHGLHALPYLANDRGQFWQEAYDHIGTRVSHGCIRLLPEDAEDLYSLTEVGTEIYIRA